MAGKGSIEKRGENNYRLIYSDGMDAAGKQIKITKTVHAKNDKEAEKALARYVTEIETGNYFEPTKITFSEFVSIWLRDYANDNLAPKTLFRYKQILFSRIIPAMGHIKIGKIKPLHLLEFYKNLQEDGIREDGKKGGLSEKTILQHHRIISSIFSAAVQWQIVSSNPASRVKPPKVQKKEAECYNTDQLQALIIALENEPLKYRAVIILAIATGLRRGELMGLEWSDIDFKECTIRVIRSSQYIPGRGNFVKEPKNETSKRVIVVPNFAINLLKKHKVQQAEDKLAAGEIWQGSNRVFTTLDGNPMHVDTLSKWFPKFLKKNNLKPLPFHGLRHTSLSLSVSQGVPLINVSRRAGHANLSTTSIYLHALQSGDREAAEKLDAFLNANGSNIEKGQS